MDKNSLRKFSIFFVIIFFIMVLNLIYFKSTKVILDQRIKNKLLSPVGEIGVYEKINEAQVASNTINKDATTISPKPITVLKTTLEGQSAEAKLLENVDLTAKATTTLTGIQVLVKDEAAVENLENSSVEYKQKKLKNVSGHKQHKNGTCNHKNSSGHKKKVHKNSSTHKAKHHKNSSSHKAKKQHEQHTNNTQTGANNQAGQNNAAIDEPTKTVAAGANTVAQKLEVTSTTGLKVDTTKEANSLLTGSQDLKNNAKVKEYFDKVKGQVIQGIDMVKDKVEKSNLSDLDTPKEGTTLLSGSQDFKNNAKVKEYFDKVKGQVIQGIDSVKDKVQKSDLADLETTKEGTTLLTGSQDLKNNAKVKEYFDKVKGQVIQGIDSVKDKVEKSDLSDLDTPKTGTTLLIGSQDLKNDAKVKEYFEKVKAQVVQGINSVKDKVQKSDLSDLDTPKAGTTLLSGSQDLENNAKVKEYFDKVKGQVAQGIDSVKDKVQKSDLSGLDTPKAETTLLNGSQDLNNDAKVKEYFEKVKGQIIQGIDSVKDKFQKSDLSDLDTPKAGTTLLTGSQDLKNDAKVKEYFEKVKAQVVQGIDMVKDKVQKSELSDLNT